ncbi:hypothetical protein TNCV_2602951 [Trichonephila clavipes]|nr:hypothetical protein TNCV_2602951 [Trichonephila clavipes]
MAAVDFLHHENPSTWTGVEPATLGTEGQRYTNHRGWRDSFSKPEIDECHLVRDQDCRVDGVGTPNQELQYGFALPLPKVVSQIHPTTKR